eukprot:Blabericola_migrator_1__633@NODE_1158_length_5254_cov_72_579719_g788_i0_p2_GENE_NODE_1158_length_5254_cov_72_579719_g788_i0NODE_1158_length_5254_cov_72_579719_g788_i0_p2_ORF_typecomplete_len475_score71_21DEAD/PF00270_29/1_3e29DEAD/PF00270_29/26Helicase_C/PF00271_31/2_8e25ResIII/PF04851_15/1_5e07ResIII/PF04851_15/4_8e03ERCC3_RAD25_C/PF16203_5/6_2e05AAA_19/PF13245_6/0_0071Flavi_DEAD/PF07652_14/0_2Flavi_DEAD/PF07652_14/3_4e02Helicase_RecD/PF05127_14/0_075UvrDhelicase/PF00580_21/0_046Glutaredoxin2_C
MSQGAAPEPIEASPTKNESSVTAEFESGVAEEIKVVREDEEADIPNLPARHQKLEEGTESYVEVERRPGEEDLISALSWEDLQLPPALQKGVLVKGFASPSKIQAVALPYILRTSGHLIAQAKNGSGKTAAFALAMIAKVDTSVPHVQCLALAPARELAKQNLDVVEELAKFTDVKGALGCPPFKSCPPGTHIISGTPGKVRDWLTRKQIDPHMLRVFVLDEADVMIDQEANMGTQVFDIAKVVRRNKNLQILLFSATYAQRVRSFADAMAPNARRLVMKKESLTLATTEQFYAKISPETGKKLEVLSDLYDGLQVGQSVIFCNSRVAAHEVSKFMESRNFSVTLICGSGQNQTGIEVTMQEREERMQQFRSGVTRVLVTTDLLSRGIDVPAVTLVINYELPTEKDKSAQYETYLHRVGRTGRFGLRGMAINFVTSPADLNLIHNIMDYYKCEIKELDLDYEKIVSKLGKLRLP